MKSSPRAAAERPRLRAALPVLVALALATAVGWNLIPACAAPVGPAEVAAVTADGEPSRNDAERRLTAAARRTEALAAANDRDGLFVERARLLVLATEPAIAPDALYFVGFADSVIASLTDADVEGELGGEVVDHGIAHLRTALEARPDDAETHALLAMLQTQKMKFAGLEALSLTGRATDAMERALELAPGNPRVVLVDGIRLLNLPGFLGGDEERALERLQEAAAIFTTWSPPRETSARWGHADALAWAGFALMESGDLQAARSSFQRALEIVPHYAWVEGVFLPQLDALEDRR